MGGKDTMLRRTPAAVNGREEAFNFEETGDE
jgi:hypothetical protein